VSWSRTDRVTDDNINHGADISIPAFEPQEDILVEGLTSET